VSSDSAKRLNVNKVKPDGDDRVEISYMEHMLYNIKSLQVELSLSVKPMLSKSS